jgi:hypothetical protein
MVDYSTLDLPFIWNMIQSAGKYFKNELEKDHREIIRELLDLEKFNTVKLAHHTLCWDNGVDFAPEYLYEQVVTQKKVA